MQSVVLLQLWVGTPEARCSPASATAFQAASGHSPRSAAAKARESVCGWNTRAAVSRSGVWAAAMSAKPPARLGRGRPGASMPPARL